MVIFMDFLVKKHRAEPCSETVDLVMINMYRSNKEHGDLNQFANREK